MYVFPYQLGVVEFLTLILQMRKLSEVQHSKMTYKRYGKIELGAEGLCTLECSPFRPALHVPCTSPPAALERGRELDPAVKGKSLHPRSPTMVASYR